MQQSFFERLFDDPKVVEGMLYHTRRWVQERSGRMTSEEEAIEVLKHTLPYTSEFADARNIAIRSIEACGKVSDYLDSRIAETTRDMEEDPDNEEWYLGYWECLHELKAVIGNFMKGVEE